MSQFEPLKRRLADTLKRREISQIVYFHTDHFEPWRPLTDDAPSVSVENAADLAQFAEAMQRIDFARRLTLFYKPHINYGMVTPDRGVAVAGDRLGFHPRTSIETEISHEAINYLARETQHEFQLHVHHESYTFNSSARDPESAAYLAAGGRQFDSQRLALGIRLGLDVLRSETGRPFDRWFFIHGHWALNASDTSECNVVDEIELLLRGGCLGDFTMPAGRPQVDARYEMPFLVRPHNVEKGYDLPEAEPEPAFGAGRGAKGKFFIWSSKIKHGSTSLDYISGFVRKRADHLDQAAMALVEDSYAEDGVLFVKTHAHAMHPYYFRQSRSPVFPHQFPATQAMLSLVFDAGASAGMETSFLSAGEVYDLILGGRRQPQVDLAAQARADLAQASSGLIGRAQEMMRPAAKPHAHPPAAPAPGRSAPLFDLLAGELNRLAGDFALRRIADMGDVASGCYGYYAQRARAGETLPDYERTLARALLDMPPPPGGIVEIGSGLGLLTLLLALNGVPAAGVERDGKRYAASLALRSAATALDPEVERTASFLHGRFPAARRGGAGAIAVVGNLVATHGPDELPKMIAALGAYDAAIVDIDRFVELRASDARRAELLAAFAAAGFEPPTIFAALGDSGNYMLFRPSPALRRRLKRAEMLARFAITPKIAVAARWAERAARRAKKVGRRLTKPLRRNKG